MRVDYRRRGTRQIEEWITVKPAPFDYHAPSSLDEAVGLLSELGDAAKVLAGGQSLIPMLSLRLTAFDHLVDIGKVNELSTLSVEKGVTGGELVIGATTVQRVVGDDPVIAQSVPLLAMATPLIGHFQIRNRGTIGGSIAHADPAAEYPAVALVLDAEIEAASSRGARRIRADEFFESTWTTSLQDDELLTAIRFPVWSGRSGFAIKELARRHGDFALVGVVSGVQMSDSGEVSRCAMALFGMGSTPVRCTAAEEAMVGRTPSPEDLAEVSHLAIKDLEPTGDLHASKEYRLHVAVELARRSLSEALEKVAAE